MARKEEMSDNIGNMSGGNLSNDSLVNVASSVVSLKGTIYTIFQLNSYFKQYGDGKEHHANLKIIRT